MRVSIVQDIAELRWYDMLYEIRLKQRIYRWPKSLHEHQGIRLECRFIEVSCLPP